MPKAAVSVPSKKKLDEEIKELDKKEKKRKRKKRSKKDGEKKAVGRHIAPLILIVTLIISYLIIVLS